MRRSMGTFFDLIQLVGGLRRHDRWSRARLQAHQAAELQRLRAYAYEHSRFYRRFHAGLTARPVEDLPVLTRQTLMENFDELVTDPDVRLDSVREYLLGLPSDNDRPFLGRYRVVASPGTEGEPGVFLYGKDAWGTALAGMARLYEWSGHPIRLTHRPKTVTLAPSDPSHVLTQMAMSAEAWRPLWPVRRISPDEPLERIVEYLNAWQPEVLGLYPSMARALAELQSTGLLQISPRLVTIGSEMVTPDTRTRVATAWGRQPFEAYGTTEVTGLAAECTHHMGLHLMEDLALVEVVDGRNRPVPPGEYGAKVLVSVFSRRTQPLIRYELPDSIRIAAEPCHCGRPFALVSSIQGRVSDALRLPGRAGHDATVWPSTFAAALDDLPSSGWQVRHGSDGSLTVLVVAAASTHVEELALDRVRNALDAVGADHRSVAVERVASLPRAGDGRVLPIRHTLPPRNRPPEPPQHT